MNKSYSILVIIGLFILTNCKPQTMAHTEKIDACTLVMNPEVLYKLAAKDSLPSIMKRSNDSCNVQLVDFIIDQFVKTPDKKNYAVMYQAASHSDGYLSDYFVEKMSIIYHKAFIPFLTCLMNSQQNKNLEKFLVEYWSDVASLSRSPDETVNQIKIEARRKLLDAVGENPSQLPYLDSLLRRIDPGYRD